MGLTQKFKYFLNFLLFEESFAEDINLMSNIKIKRQNSQGNTHDPVVHLLKALWRVVKYFSFKMGKPIF